MGQKGPAITGEREEREYNNCLEDCRRERNPAPEKVKLEGEREPRNGKQRRREVSDSDSNTEPSEKRRQERL